MHVLVVYCHPCPDSFSAAQRDAAIAGLTAAGHTVELRDLYAEDFDPTLPAAQRRAYFNEAANAAGLEAHVDSLRHCDGLVLVYPTWWFGMPAMLKGWFDRVWLPGVAFRLGGVTALRPLLQRLRRIGVVTTYGSPWWLVWWAGRPDWLLVHRAFKPLCAPKCKVEWLALTRMDRDSPQRRTRFLATIQSRLSAWR
ncbi:MAG: NAD(P)H-dependent oxidoreductase [Acetobacteraceae bacterium]